MKEELVKIIDSNSLNEKPVERSGIIRGMVDLRLRLGKACELALLNYEGDILEIGAHIGRSTVILAALAKKYNRKVIVIDPWDGRQEGNESVYQTFKQNTKEFEDIIEINRLDSMSDEAKTIIKENKFAFCWIDGLHTVEACKSDIDSCSTQKGIIAVDDLSWSTGLEDLFKEKANEYKFFSYYNPVCREGYYIND